MSIDNNTGKTKGFYERGQAIFDRISGMPEDDAPAKTGPTKICGPNLVEVLNAAGFYQKKEWVGLTDDEFDAINPKLSLFQFHKAIEAKLKEKNGG